MKQKNSALENLRKHGASGVKIYNVNDDFVCDECKKLEGIEFTFDEAPILPHAKCTREGGCRCYYQPFVSLDDFSKKLDEIFDN